jgi:hypothetical protein
LKKIIYISILTIAFFGACKKDKEIEEVVDVKTIQTAKLHVHNTVGNQAVNYSTIYTDNLGKRFNISLFRYYITNLKFIKDDGTEILSSTKTILVNPDIADYTLGDFPVGSYKGIKFTIGVDSVSNHSDPTLLPESNPLSIQTPPMHWSWNSGYIFMKFEGNSDTTSTNNGSLNQPLVYHIGLDKYLKTVQINSAFSITSDKEKELVLQADVKKWLNGVNLKTETETHSFNFSGTADKLTNNINSMFSLAN